MKLKFDYSSRIRDWDEILPKVGEVYLAGFRGGGVENPVHRRVVRVSVSPELVYVHTEAEECGT